MKTKTLMVLSMIAGIANVGASQTQTITEEVVVSSPKSHNLYGAKQLVTESQSLDPYDLSELATDYFNKGQFEEAAKIFVRSVLYGNSDNKDSLIEIDSESSKFLSLKDLGLEPQPYYKDVLIPKVVKHMKFQYDNLEKHKKDPVILYE